MATEYLSFFNLNDDPFHLTPDTAYFYNSPEHATALLSLEYCITQKSGFCLLTGEPGTGKTTIQRIFTEKWKERAEIALIMTPRLMPDEFFQAVLDDFQIPLSASKNKMLKDFRSFLLINAEKDKRVVIIVDEAQELPESTLEELRLLSNMETEKEKLLQIILIGQPELRNKLLNDSLRQLNQRISVRVQLDPLTEPETSDYINTRLIKGGNSTLLYDQKAKNLIFNLSGGVPRTINLLSSRALMSAFLDESKIVSEKHVQTGAKDVMDPLASKNNKPKNLTEQRLQGAPALDSASSEGGSALGRLAALVAGIRNKLFGSNSQAPVFQHSTTPPEPPPATADAGEDWVMPAPAVSQKLSELPPSNRPMGMLELEVGYGLAPMQDAAQAGDLYERIRFIRQQTIQKMGFDVPLINVHTNLQLKAYEYILLIRGTRVGGSELPGQYLAIDSGAVTASMRGLSAREPIFGLPAVWIRSDDREQAQNNGYTIVDSTTVVATHISELIKRYSHELIGRREMQLLLDGVSTTSPKVVERLIPNLLDIDTVEKVVKKLLEEGESIRDLRAILECLTIYSTLSKDPDVLTGYVRQGRGEIIIDQYKAG
jgi:type II secretory pathway predicted ATPase ExeA